MTATGAGTPVGPRRCLDLLRGISATDEEERRNWADVAGLWSSGGELDPVEQLTLSWPLAWAAVVETHRFEVREGLLLSLDDLAAGRGVPAAVLELVTSAIEPGDLHVAEVELYQDLVAARSRPTREIPPTELPNLPGARSGEPVGPAQCLHLVRRITSGSPDDRRGGAAVTAGRAAAGGFDDDEARTLGAVLGWAVEVEADSARPALLAALDALAGRDRVPPWALDRVLAHLAGGPLDPVEEGFRADLATALAAHRRRADG